MLAHPDAGLLRGVDDPLIPAGVRQVGIEAAAGVAVASGGAERLEGDPQPRAGHLAGVDGVAHRHAVVAAAHVAGAGEALLQQLAGEHGVVEGPVSLDANGTLAPGASATAGTIAADSLAWQANGVVHHRLGANDGDSDHTELSGALTRSGAGTYHFNFSDADMAPVPGASYTLMTFASQSGFSAADFDYSYAGANEDLVGEFQLNATSLVFHVISTPVELQSFDVD